AAANAEEKPEEKKEEASNTEEAANTDDMEFAQNAQPAQGLVKDIAEGLGITFIKTPSFPHLAKAAGIDYVGKPFPELLAALNAKRAEFTKTITTASAE